jgi:hypothetical protein
MGIDSFISEVDIEYLYVIYINDSLWSVNSEWQVVFLSWTRWMWRKYEW